MNAISIDVAADNPSELVVKPARYLGNSFPAYLDATRRAGCRYEPRDKTNRIPVRHFPRLVDVLSNDFTLLPAPEVAERVETLANELNAQEKAAQSEADARGLYPFQVAGVAFLRGRKRALLADDMGLGKTVQALCALPTDARPTVIVICPNVVKGSWCREISKWTGLQAFTAKTKKQVRNPLPGEVLVLNYEQVPKDDSESLQLQADFVIVDEAHYLKNSKAQRTVNARAVLKRSGVVWGLTGTPLMNRPPELWGVLQSLGLATEAYGSWKSFCVAFDGYRGAFGFEWGENPTPAATEGLERVALRRKKTEVLKDLPVKQFSEHICELDRAANKDLDRMLTTLEDEHGIYLDDITEDNMPDIGALSESRAALALAKLPIAEQLATQYEEAGEPVVFFSAHVAAIKALGAREGWGCITGETHVDKRTELVEAFQSGALVGLACTIKAAGVGITLTRASQMVFIDRSYVPAENWQAEDRICRIGQDRGCCYTFIVANHVLDRRVHEILEFKRVLIEETVDRVAPVNVDAEKLFAVAAQIRASLESEISDHDGFPDFSADIVQSTPAPKKFRAPNSADEAWALTSLLFLAADDTDRASVRNGFGFNRIDNDIGHSLAAQLESRGGLTDKQWTLAIKICKHYPKQVGVCPEG